MSKLVEGVDAEVMVGPFLSAADGKTPMTSLNILRTNLRLSLQSYDDSNLINFRNPTDISQGPAVHAENGYYKIVLPGVDLSKGILRACCNMPGCLPVWKDYFIDENLIDIVTSMVGAPDGSPGLIYPTDGVVKTRFGYERNFSFVPLTGGSVAEVKLDLVSIGQPNSWTKLALDNVPHTLEVWFSYSGT